MKLKSAILVLAVSAGAWAQSPSVVLNVRNTMNGVQQQKTSASNAALAAAGQNTAPAPSKLAAPVQAKPSAAAAKPAAVPAPNAAASKPGNSTTPVKSAASQPSKPVHPAGIAKAAKAPKTTPVAVIVPKTASPKKGKAKKTVAAAAPASAPAAKPEEKPAGENPADKKFSVLGKRDPFLSPVVAHTNGSGCSTGKKCLDIGQISLRGVVKAENGMVAVVTNSMNKAYFLHENDPVFNGYVIKITGDSIVFKETFQDHMGKPASREVVKKINTPAV